VVTRWLRVVKDARASSSSLTLTIARAVRDEAPRPLRRRLPAGHDPARADRAQRHVELVRFAAVEGVPATPDSALLFTSGPSRSEAVGTLRGEPLYHASLDPEEYESLLAENGFVVRDHVVNDPQCHRTV
jgi:hypothetical protein